MSRSSKALHLVVPVKLVAPFTLIAHGSPLWDGGLQMDVPPPPLIFFPTLALGLATLLVKKWVIATSLPCLSFRWKCKKKKRNLGPVARRRVKVFGGCLSGDDVFQQFQAQQKERDEKEQRALARESALALGRDMRFFFEQFDIKFKEAQVEWTAWKKANVPRAPRRTYARCTPTTATSTPSTSMPLLPNDPLLQALTMPPILPSSSLPLTQLDNSYMDPFGTSVFNMSMGGMPLLPTVLPSTMQPSMPLPPLPMDPSVPLCTPLDGSLGAFGTTPMVLDFNSMAPSLPLLY